MTQPTPPPFDGAAAAELMAQLVDSLKMLSETARGYREILVQHGWPESTADQLAAALLASMQTAAMGGTQVKP